jgi:hypothetical protein
VRECFCGRAFQAIGTLTPGCEIFGFTKGQFSLMDLIIAILEQTGPASVDISTWTAGDADIRHCYQFVESGKIVSARWVVDRSFPTRQPDYFKALCKRFSPESIRITRTHAKFCLIRNDEWDIALRSSMNLNKNPRFENFEISDDAALAGYFSRVVDEIFSDLRCGREPSGSEVEGVFQGLEVQGESYDQTEINFGPNGLW